MENLTLKISIVSGGPGLKEVRDIHGHSSEWVQQRINDDSIEYKIYHMYNGDKVSIDDSNGWIITGSASSVLDELPWMLKLEEFIRELVETNIPLFGICFGHQLIAKALNGVVEKNVLGWEIGSYPIDLTEAGNNSPIFANFKDSLHVYETHQDVVTSLPSGAIETSRNNKGNQGFQMNDTIFGTQFHPEFSREIMQDLADYRQSKGGVVDDPTIPDADASNQILRNFIHVINERKQ